MKTRIIFIAAMFMLVAGLVTAQVPQLINYQGKLTDAKGNSIDGTFSMLFSIYTTENGGTALWSETQNVTVTDGLFSVLLGTNTAIPYSVFAESVTYLELKVGSDPAMTPRQRMASVGYAMHSYDADKLGGHQANAFIRSVDGITAQAGNIDLIEGSNITIESNSDNKTITISAAGGSSGGDLTLPYTGTTESSSSAFSITNTGTGRAGYFKINNSANSNQVIYAETNGTGRVGHFRIVNSANDKEAVAASTQGSGPALSGYTTGSGMAVHGRTDGTGEAGHFEITNSSNSQNTVQATTDGAGNAVYGKHNSSGNYGALGGNNSGVAGVSNDVGVKGTCTSAQGIGVQGVGSGNGTGVMGSSSYGIGVSGKCSNGTAVSAEGDLFVTGAFRGNISSHSGNDGAPFPRPAYDSGWFYLGQGKGQVLAHSIGKNIDNYVIDIQFKDTINSDTFGIHNYKVGGDDGGLYYYGAFWRNLTNSTIEVRRSSNDERASQIRVRIWYYN